MTPSISALRAWADAAIEHRDMNNGRGDRTLTLLAGELSPTDEEARGDLCNDFLRWRLRCTTACTPCVSEATGHAGRGCSVHTSDAEG